MTYRFNSNILVSLITLFVLFWGCEETSNPTYGNGAVDPNPPGSATPIIEAIYPNPGHFSEIVTIFGSNFHPDPVHNIVSFGNIVCKVYGASTTELQVETPDLINDTVIVKVASKGAELFSNQLDYIMGPPFELVDDQTLGASGVTGDESYNVYIGSVDEGLIYIIGADGSKNVFANVPVDGAIEFGPAEYLYVCEKGNNKIVRISKDGSTIEDYLTVPSPIDFDWDANGNLYIVSSEQGVYLYNKSGELSLVETLALPKSCRIFGDRFFVTDDKEILVYDITDTGLENKTLYTKMLSTAGGLEFSADGKLYTTASVRNRLYEITDSTTVLLYKNQLTKPVDYLTYYQRGIYLVNSVGSGTGIVLRVHLGVDQAPNYGRDN